MFYVLIGHLFFINQHLLIYHCRSSPNISTSPIQILYSSCEKVGYLRCLSHSVLRPRRPTHIFLRGGITGNSAGTASEEIAVGFKFLRLMPLCFLFNHTWRRMIHCLWQIMCVFLQAAPPPFARNQPIFSRQFYRYARVNQRQRFLFFRWFQFPTSLVIDDEFSHLISLRFRSSLLWDLSMSSSAQVVTSTALASTHDVLGPFFAPATNLPSPAATC